MAVCKLFKRKKFVTATRREKKKKGHNQSSIQYITDISKTLALHPVTVSSSMWSCRASSTPTPLTVHLLGHLCILTWFVYLVCFNSNAVSSLGNAPDLFSSKYELCAKSELRVIQSRAQDRAARTLSASKAPPFVCVTPHVALKKNKIIRYL